MIQYYANALFVPFLSIKGPIEPLMVTTDLRLYNKSSLSLIIITPFSVPPVSVPDIVSPETSPNLSPVTTLSCETSVTISESDWDNVLSSNESSNEEELSCGLSGVSSV